MLQRSLNRSITDMQDQATAAKLVKEIKCRCVTLEGDDFNPGGTLTGGSRRSGGAQDAAFSEFWYLQNVCKGCTNCANSATARSTALQWCPGCDVSKGWIRSHIACGRFQWC